ncbi:TRCF domain-containing protein, partial [Arenibaculum sp.]|uniref:TRCF domain-containing protein n=1 Tax=Arenibaculum sp. TaxID=2865862 RepID=UPI002E14EB7F|nr:TRCF domain-containing protein [Arenibaculum sp.]
GGEPEAFWTPRVALDLPVLIPETYVRDVGERLTLYGRIARILDDEEAETVAAELAERHGPPPTEVSTLLHVAELRRLCRLAGIEQLDVGPKGVLIGFRSQAGLAAFLAAHPEARGRPDRRASLALAERGGSLEAVRRLLVALPPAGERLPEAREERAAS